MLIEIFSDIMCPFCYIGKRRFENALEKADFKNDIRVIWKSYQLAPEMKTDPSKNIHQYLAEHKNISIDKAKELNQYVTDMAKESGLIYDFSKAIPANSFNAHRLSHFALKHNKQKEAEELLFKSYFTEGKNIDDLTTLADIAAEAGLDRSEALNVLKSGAYAEEVENDQREAFEIGVRGVPFFVFNRRYAVSGAQPEEVFLNTLNKSYEEYKSNDH